MPYIRQSSRAVLDPCITQTNNGILTLGDLNYTVSRLALGYFVRNGLTYANIAGVLGTLFLVPLEILRRIVNRYEDQKISSNGDLPEYKKLMGKDYN